MNTAILIVCHQVPHYWIAQARKHPDCQFYIHYDLRSDIAPLEQEIMGLNNIHVLSERKLIHWGGFSQVEATLLLIKEALKKPENHYFHLVSGSCVALHPLEVLDRHCQTYAKNSLFLESYEEPKRHYRRFNTPHADTNWQRSLVGKVLTKCYQLLSMIVSAKDFPTGSNWFSAGREALEWLDELSDESAQQFFRHKLCPDEHFFQYLVSQNVDNTILHEKCNHRFIYFESIYSNHPESIDKDKLESLYGNMDYWFARKVDDKTALAILNKEKDVT